jgi:ATP synthase protein I
MNIARVRGVRRSLQGVADIVRRVMADDQPPKRPQQQGADAGWAAIGYLLSGMLVWGGVGWLIDKWLGLPDVGLLIGLIGGGAAGVYLIMKRLDG